MIALSAMYLLVWWHGDLDAERTNCIMCTAAQREGLTPDGSACVVPNGKTYKEGMWAE